MKTTALMIAGWLGWAVLPATTTGAERFAREIETAPRTEEDLVSVPLDAEVYQHALPSLADLRVYDQQSREVGYLLRHVPATETTVVRRTGTLRATQLSLTPRDDAGLELLLTFGDDDPAPDGLRLVTPLKNFEQHVRVLASADGQDWQPLAEGLLFDYSRFMDVRSDSISLPRTKHKRLKIIVAAVTVEQESELMELTRQLRGDDAQRTEKVLVERRPFRIDRVEFWTEQAEQQTQTVQLTDYQSVPFTATEESKAKQTRIILDTQSQPVTVIRLQTPDRNFSRRVAVEREVVSGQASRWESISSAELMRFDFRTLQRENLTITIPETRASRYRLVIENRDSPPLTIEKVDLRGPVRELLFLATAEGRYTLGYGGELPAASYDTAALDAALRATKSTIPAKLSAKSAPLASPPPIAINNPWLLTTIIVLLVCALAWGLYQAAQRVDLMTDAPEGSDSPSDG